MGTGNEVNSSSNSIKRDGGGDTSVRSSVKRSSRMNSFEFETVRPDQKVLTPDEKASLLSPPPPPPLAL